MGLSSVKDNPELARQLHAHILKNPLQHPGTADSVEVLDISRVVSGWRVTVGLSNQGESGIDTLVLDKDSPSLDGFR